MLDQLQACFKQEFQLSHMAALINHVGNVVGILQPQYVKDKNAALDAVVKMLQSFKDVEPVQSEKQG